MGEPPTESLHKLSLPFQEFIKLFVIWMDSDQKPTKPDQPMGNRGSATVASGRQLGSSPPPAKRLGPTN